MSNLLQYFKSIQEGEKTVRESGRLRKVENNRSQFILNSNILSEIITATDVTNISFLEQNKFQKIGTIENLFENKLPKADNLYFTGLYVITVPEKYEVKFLDVGYTLNKRNVIKPWTIEKLKSKWVNDCQIIYYGIAGAKSFRTLYKRLNDLIKHGMGKTTDRGPHKGGEIMWQLKGYEKFTIWILPIENPRVIEEQILRKFYEIKNKLPFANRQF